MSTQSVIKELRQKTPSGFSSPVKIGADQRYISALLNSNVNNLEEQSILGVDCLTISWEENDVKYTTKKFYDGTHITDSHYYILFIEEYDTSGTGSNFYFYRDTLRLPRYELGGNTFEEILDDPGNYYLKCNDENLESGLYTFDEEGGFGIIPDISGILRKEVLCLRTDTSSTSDEQILSDIKIAEKIVTVEIDAQNKTRVQETITNYLS